MNLLTQKYFTFVIVLICFISCTKQKNKPSEELIGKWEWKSTDILIERWNGFQYFTDTLTIYPQTVGFTASLEINKNGKVFFYRNDMIFFQSTYSNEMRFKYIIENDSIKYEFKDFPIIYIQNELGIHNAPAYCLEVYKVPIPNVYVTSNKFVKQ